MSDTGSFLFTTSRVFEKSAGQESPKKDTDPIHVAFDGRGFAGTGRPVKTVRIRCASVIGCDGADRDILRRVDRRISLILLPDDLLKPGRRNTFLDRGTADGRFAGRLQMRNRRIEFIKKSLHTINGSGFHKKQDIQFYLKC